MVQCSIMLNKWSGTMNSTGYVPILDRTSPSALNVVWQTVLTSRILFPPATVSFSFSKNKIMGEILPHLGSIVSLVWDSDIDTIISEYLPFCQASYSACKVITKDSYGAPAVSQKNLNGSSKLFSGVHSAAKTMADRICYSKLHQ